MMSPRVTAHNYNDNNNNIFTETRLQDTIGKNHKIPMAWLTGWLVVW